MFKRYNRNRTKESKEIVDRMKEPGSINSIAGALIFIDQPYARFQDIRQNVKTKPNVAIFLTSAVQHETHIL